MAAAVPSQPLQVGVELISLARLLLTIKAGVEGDRSQTGTFVTIFGCYILTDLSSVCSVYYTGKFHSSLNYQVSFRLKNVILLATMHF